MNKTEIINIENNHYMPVFSRYNIVLSHGEGACLYDSEGKEYLDFLAGIAVNALGHAHPALISAITEQAKKVIHCSNLYHTEVQAKLVKKLTDLSGFDRVFFANSGAEANEGAIKLARKYGKKVSLNKVKIVVAENSFHGRTYMTLAATGQKKYQAGYEPLPEGFCYVDYNNIEALEKSVDENTCAILLETIQGEGGVNIATLAYLEKARELADKYDALLIFDEIQTGIGRTGYIFSYEYFGIKPDAITLAKALGGGVPIGAFLTNEKFAKAFKAGDHGSTFGGNPLACAAGITVLETLESEKLLENTKHMGLYMQKKLQKLQNKYPGLIKDIRGVGLMIGVELSKSGREFVDGALSQGIIINATAGNVLRLVPPLIINENQVNKLISVLDDVFDKYQ